MTHKSLVECCELLGLSVSEVPSRDGRKPFKATRSGFTSSVLVWWSTTDDGLRVLGLPTVTAQGRDTDARTLKEIKYLVGLGE